MANGAVVHTTKNDHNVVLFPQFAARALACTALRLLELRLDARPTVAEVLPELELLREGSNEQETAMTPRGGSPSMRTDDDRQRSSSMTADDGYDNNRFIKAYEIVRQQEEERIKMAEQRERSYGGQ